MKRCITDYKRITVSGCRTHHIMNNEPLSEKIFFEVLSFHAPGLAAVSDETGAYHIDIHVKPLYKKRYKRTFGFYYNRAAIADHDDNWFHINVEGNKYYNEVYEWCGNYQEDCSVVCDSEDNYFHIDLNGNPLYSESFQYAGDFRDGIAVVQNRQGLHTHIDKNGSFIHNQWFIDLDVYHKGFAIAAEQCGYMHINLDGMPVYSERYKKIEPFYNGFARVEDFDGSIRIINETGRTVRILRSPQKSLFSELSSDIVGYWKTYTIYTAIKIGVFDFIDINGYIDYESLIEKNDLDSEKVTRLIRALAEMGLVKKVDQNWQITQKGKFLEKSQSNSLYEAAIEYVETLSDNWYNLSEKFIKNSSDGNLNHFRENEENRRLHRMLESYAENDYRNIAHLIEIEKSNSLIVDAGGGGGYLAREIKKLNRSAQVKVLELPEVCSIYNNSELNEEIDYLKGDFLLNWNIKADVIILSRVIHDWPDEQVEVILRNAYKALNDNGKLFIIEMLLSEYSYNGALCDMHLLANTGGKERNLNEFNQLLSSAGFRVGTVVKPQSVVSIIKAEKESQYNRQIPQYTLSNYHRLPSDLPVAMLVRHSVRPFLISGARGDEVSLTEEGVNLAEKLGFAIKEKISRIFSSPVLRCVQTGDAIARGAGKEAVSIQSDVLGAPGAFSFGTRGSGEFWRRKGHKDTLAYLSTADKPVENMPEPNWAARYLLNMMVKETESEGGLNVFVTHDSLITALVAQITGTALKRNQWPQYLDSVFFYKTENHLHLLYKDIHKKMRINNLLDLNEHDITELARRKIAMTIGLECEAEFIIAGGVFKEILTGKPAEDIDIWAVSERNLEILLNHLHQKKNVTFIEETVYNYRFETQGIIIEIGKKTHRNLEERLAGFDLTVSAIGVQYYTRDKWNAYIHPTALESVREKEIKLNRDILNKNHILATIVRMKRYAAELGYTINNEDIEEIWHRFKISTTEKKERCLKNFRNNCRYDVRIEAEALKLLQY